MSGPRSLRRIPREIRAARGYAGLTQEALAELLEVAPNSVYRWEAGENTPGPPTLKAIARETGVPAEWLALGFLAPEDPAERFTWRAGLVARPPGERPRADDASRRDEDAGDA